MRYYKTIADGYLVMIGENGVGEEITEEEYSNLLSIIHAAPKAPDGYTYKLRADTLERELVELPPVEPEPLTEEEAITRYANSITGANDPDLISAAETLITDRIKDNEE